MTAFGFRIRARDGHARRGRVTTAHGTIETPAFMAVGTAATVKAMTPEDIRDSGTEVVLGNTYHLMLRPGAERVARLGGLHRFMNWPGPILTDSGGFQVMSLKNRRQIDADGVTFRSHIDGTKYVLTAEKSVEIQHLLDADITMAFDHCASYPADIKAVTAAMDRSMAWAARSKAAFKPRPGYALFGINQGGVYPHLRQQSAEIVQSIGFDGYAIGGLAVGEGQTAMFETLDGVISLFDDAKPRYLMGVGKPDDLVGAVKRGIDMFDCVLPTRSGRTNQAFTRTGTLNMRNACHKDANEPLDEHCRCRVCHSFSRAYVHHLVMSREILAAMLLTRHNLFYYQNLMADMRAAIETGTFAAFEQNFHARRDIPAAAKQAVQAV